jgi:gluconokinase
LAAEPRHFVVMGVSGSGKTTIAGQLATRVGFTFADGDDFHPPTNVAKMARGEPLTDVDRDPWLEALRAWIAAHDRAGRSTVLACSALKRRYRDTLRAGAPQRVNFIHLTAPAEELRRRMGRRAGHFMPPLLLESQLATLEPLAGDEPGLTLDATFPPKIVIERILDIVRVNN